MRAILTYHSIDESGSPISISRVEFRRHIEWLASGAVRVVSLGEIAEQRAVTSTVHQVALTFDDGFANFATDALPLLRAHGLPATLFVVSGHVGRTNRWADASNASVPELPLMSWDAIARAADDGVELGAHTRTHPHLSRHAMDRLHDELHGNVEDILQHTGRRVDTFAYPYGDHSSTVDDVARQTFRAACTTEFRELRATDDVATLPRLDALYFRAAGTLDGFGSPTFRALISARRVARQVRRLVRAD